LLFCFLFLSLVSLQKQLVAHSRTLQGLVADGEDRAALASRAKTLLQASVDFRSDFTSSATRLTLLENLNLFQRLAESALRR
jgi:hypothetical protein